MIKRFVIDVLYSLDVEDAPLWKQVGAVLMCFVMAVVLVSMLWFAALIQSYRM